MCACGRGKRKSIISEVERWLINVLICKHIRRAAWFQKKKKKIPSLQIRSFIIMSFGKNYTASILLIMCHRWARGISTVELPKRRSSPEWRGGKSGCGPLITGRTVHTLDITTNASAHILHANEQPLLPLQLWDAVWKDLDVSLLHSSTTCEVSAASCFY